MEKAQELYEAHAEFSGERMVRWAETGDVTKAHWRRLAKIARTDNVVKLADHRNALRDEGLQRPIKNPTIARLNNHVRNLEAMASEGFDIVAGIYATKGVKDGEFSLEYTYADTHTTLGLIEYLKNRILNGN